MGVMSLYIFSRACNVKRLMIKNTTDTTSLKHLVSSRGRISYHFVLNLLW